MDEEKIKKLEAAGFEVGETQKFLKLTSAEMACVEKTRVKVKYAS